MSNFDLKLKKTNKFCNIDCFQLLKTSEKAKKKLTKILRSIAILSNFLNLVIFEEKPVAAV